MAHALARHEAIPAVVSRTMTIRSLLSPIERRRQPRCLVDLRISLLSSKGESIAEGSVRDLSRAGARVDNLPLGQGIFDWRHAPLVPGTHIHLDLHDPAGSAPLRLRAEVRWRRNESLGLSFTRVPPEVGERLQRIMELRSIAR